VPLLGAAATPWQSGSGCRRCRRIPPSSPAHLEWLLSELHAEAAEALELRVYVVHRERGDRNPVCSQRLLERPRGGCPSGSSNSSGPSAFSGETTVSQRASPTGMSFFFTNRARWCRTAAPFPGHPRELK
jgi:hypothetical protein